MSQSNRKLVTWRYVKDVKDMRIGKCGIEPIWVIPQ